MCVFKVNKQKMGLIVEINTFSDHFCFLWCGRLLFHINFQTHPLLYQLVWLWNIWINVQKMCIPLTQLLEIFMGFTMQITNSIERLRRIWYCPALGSRESPRSNQIPRNEYICICLSVNYGFLMNFIWN